MSSLIFPLSILGAYVKDPEPYRDERIDEAVSGREYRSTWQTSPRHRWKVVFEVLRSDVGSRQDYQQLVAFYTRLFGRLDSFLFQNPDDSSVTDHGFGVGDGVTTAFQLQRALLSSYSDPLGTYTQSSKPRTNWLTWSQDYTNAAWTKGTGTLVVANAVVAPDGTASADLVQYTGAGAAGGTRLSQNSILTPANGAACSDAIWLRADAPLTLVLSNNLGQTVTVSVTTAWQRFSLAGTGTGALALGLGIASPGGVNTVFTLYAWGAQAEVAAAATQYIATTNTTVTVNPSFYPLFADGFIPIYDLNGPVSIFVDNDWQGKRQFFNVARTNLCLRSQTLTDASWTKTSLTDGGTVAAPDGTTTAQKYTSTATATAALSRSVAGLTAGLVYTAYVWLRCAATGTVKLGTTEGQSATLNVTAAFQRFPFTFTAAGASTTLTLGGSSTWPNAEILEVWGFQLELGVNATSYIATTSAAVTFTDYALSSLGVVTFTTAPLSAAILSWTGSYYFRARIDQTSLLAARQVPGFWSAEIALVSVKP